MNESGDTLPTTNPSGATVKIRLMTVDDVTRGMELKKAEGWNQERADWLRVLKLEPTCCFVATVDGYVIGTVASCMFDCVAWVGMLLVDQRFRRVGIATRLLTHVLDILDQKNVVSVRLDATPLGLRLYESLGFHAQFRVVRFGGVPRVSANSNSPIAVAPYRPEHLTNVLELDRQTTQVDRTALIGALLTQNAVRSRVVEASTGIEGFLIERPGSNAVQIGPVIASSQSVGQALIGEAIGRHLNDVCYVDIPESNDLAVSLVRAAHLSPLREFTRMCRGRPCQERAEQLWAGSGPEKG